MMNGLESNINNKKNNIIASLYHTYHEDLITRCIDQLKQAKISKNLRFDAENLVSFLYQKLLEDKDDLSSDVPIDKIRALLFDKLDLLISNFIKEIKGEKNNSNGELISTADIIRSNVPDSRVGYSPEEVARFNILLGDMSKRHKNGKKMEEILRLRMRGESLSDIGSLYGQTRGNIHRWERIAIRVLRKKLGLMYYDDSKMPLNQPLEKTLISTVDGKEVTKQRTGDVDNPPKKTHIIAFLLEKLRGFWGRE
jgi:transcriptional regulator